MVKESVAALWSRVQEEAGIRRCLESRPSGSREEVVAGLARWCRHGVRKGRPRKVPPRVFSVHEWTKTGRVIEVSLSLLGGRT